MHPGKAKAVPLIMTLPRMDFWYWCGHFVDLYRDCPYRCEYCHTRKNPMLKGVEFEPGLPEEKEVIGLGLLSDIFHPDRAMNGGVSAVLRRLYESGYPVNIVTKSDRVVDAIDALKPFAKRDHVRVTLTILSLDEELSRAIEGDAPSPSSRLEALQALRSHGIPAGVALTPIIPFVNDGEEGTAALVEQASRRGAGWFLFSGFDPVLSFLQNPRWKRSAELHGNGEALRAHYRRLKQHLVRLIHRENLPMRVPRITLNVFRSRSSNRVVSEYLFNISYIYELLERDVDMRRYRRAAYELSSVPSSLASLSADRKLGYVRGINPEIEEVIKEVLSTERSSLYDALIEETLRGKVGAEV